MARIKFYEDLLDKNFEEQKIRTGVKISTVINKYLESKPRTKQIEVYHADTDTTEFIDEEVIYYDILVQVNGIYQTDLEYKIHKDDEIVVLFVPHSAGAKQNWGTALDILGSLTLTAGTIVGFTPLGWTLLAVGSLMTLGGGILKSLGDKENGSDTSDKQGESQKLLSINGGGNQNIVGNRFPFIMGKHLVNPIIVGEPFHTTNTARPYLAGDVDNPDCKDMGQYFQALYCVGYGPLKLTDFKLNNIILAYNRSRTPTDNKRTVLHGHLEGYDNSGADNGDILRKWKNNDIELEILQAGNKESSDSKWGSIYPQVVKEDALENCNILFAHDVSILQNDRGDIMYKNTPVPCGYRTNTVRFSHSCPTKIQVELDMPEGYYSCRTESETSGDNTVSHVKYRQPPLSIAVQWRYAKSGELPSDAENPDGWNTFDRMVFHDKDGDEGFYVYPSLYTAENRADEVASNLGLTDGTLADYNDRWLGREVFHLTPRTVNQKWREATAAEIATAINEGIIQTETTEVKTSELTVTTDYPYVELSWQDTNVDSYSIVTENPNFKIEKTIYEYPDEMEIPVWDPYYEQYRTQKTEYTKSVEVADRVMILITEDANPVWNVDEANLNERRYVFEKEFTDEEVSKFLELNGTPAQYLDSVEIRVIRLTPCYIDEKKERSSDDPLGDMSYQDLVKWTYIRTWCFDKQKYISDYEKAVASGEPLSHITIKDYPLRPINEEDIDKFTYVAIRLKQDVAETGGSSLKDFSCIATQILPKYNIEEEKWYPESINFKYEYYYIDKDPLNYYRKRYNKLPLPLTDVRSIEIGFTDQTTAEEQYEFGVTQSGFATSFYKKRIGNDFVDTIRNEVFIGENLSGYSVKRGTLVSKYVLPLDFEQKYITQNSAAVAVSTLVGSLLKEDAKTYDSIMTDKFADMYEFCNDVTDGTPQNYQLPDSYKTTIDLTSSARTVSGSSLLSVPWGQSSDAYADDYVNPDGYYHVFGVHYTYDYNGNPTDTNYAFTLVVTPIIVEEGVVRVLSKTEVQESVDAIALGNTPTFNILLARFDGPDSVLSAKAYEESIEYFEKVFFNSTATYTAQREKLLKLKEIPVNAVASGVKDDYLQSLCLAFTHYKIAYSVDGETFYSDAERTQVIYLPYNANPQSLGDSVYVYSVPLGFEYIPYFRNIIEQHSTSYCTNKICAASDGLLHIQYNCNGVISKDVKMENLFAQILATGRSSYKRGDSNKYEPLIGRPNPYPVTVLNQRCVISKSNSRVFKNDLSGYSLSFIDESDDYNPNDLYVMADGEDPTDYRKKIEPLSIPYVTNRKQLYSIARFNLATVLFQKETYSRTIGFLGYTITLGDVVLIQDDSLLIGTDKGGRIHQIIEDDNKIYGFVTDELYEYTGEMDGEHCVQGCTFVQPGKYQESRCATIRMAGPSGILKDNGERIKSTIGKTNLVVFESPILKNSEMTQDPDDSKVDGVIYTYHPKLGNLVAFGKMAAITSKAVVVAVRPKAKDQFDLSLVPYNEELYNYGCRIPDFENNMTSPTRESTIFSLTDNPTVSKFEEKTNRQNNYALATIVDLYSNHIVTLYKDVTGEPPSVSGITSDAFYNFSNNAFSWDDDTGSNGWSTVVPGNPQGQIYVTTATAYGRSKIDTISPNEWAEPIAMGMNGTNGINTYTIQLFKRGTNQPAEIPADLTYRFSTGETSCSNYNGWSTGLTSVDEDNLPIWEIHATALSTTDSDVIRSGDTWEESGWSTPIKMSQSGYSKTEIMSWIEQSVLETPNVTSELDGITFAVNMDGLIPTEQMAVIPIHVIQNSEELPFEIGEIILPDGMSYYRNGNSLIIIAEQGAKVKPGSTVIPIIYTKYETYEVLINDDNVYWDGEKWIGSSSSTDDLDVLVTVNDDDNTYYGEISTVEALPESPEVSEYFYWSGIDTVVSEEIEKEGIFTHGMFYSYDGAQWYQSVVVPIGQQTVAVSQETFNLPFNWTTITGGTYRNAVKTTSSIPTDPVIGDYFCWTGTDKTHSDIVLYGSLLSGCLYKWNGTLWERDRYSVHIAAAMKDEMSIAEELLSENNSDVTEFFDKVVSNDIFVKRLKVTEEAIIPVLATAQVVIGDPEKPELTPFIQSVNFSTTNKTGFKLDGNTGKITAHSAEIFGTIHATTLYIGSGSDEHEFDPSDIPDTANLLVESTPVYYRTTSSDAPAQPTSEVTRNDVVDGAWTKNHLSWVAGTYVYTCNQNKKSGGNLVWTPVITDTITIISGGYIHTGLIDASEIQIGSLDGYTGLKNLVDSKETPEGAQSKANTAQTTSQTNLAQKFGYASYEDLVSKASSLGTIVDGGYIRTSLIHADAVWSKIISAGTLDATNATINNLKVNNGSITNFTFHGLTMDYGTTFGGVALKSPNYNMANPFNSVSLGIESTEQGKDKGKFYCNDIYAENLHKYSQNKYLSFYDSVYFTRETIKASLTTIAFHGSDYEEFFNKLSYLAETYTTNVYFPCTGYVTYNNTYYVNYFKITTYSHDHNPPYITLSIAFEDEEFDKDFRVTSTFIQQMDTSTSISKIVLRF